MNKEQFEREKKYQTAISVAKTMLLKGLINDTDYRMINTILIQKYCPIFGGLCENNS